MADEAGDEKLPEKEEKPVDAAKVAAFIDKHGSTDAAVRVLLSENYDFRDKNRALAAKLPKEGETLLSAEETKAYLRYKEFGDPKTVKEQLDRIPSLAKELGLFHIQRDAARAAKAHNLDPEALAEIAKDKGITFVFQETKGKDGKAVEIAHVKDGDETEVALDSFVSKLPSAYQLALKSVEKRPEPGPSRNGGPPEPSVKTQGAASAGGRVFF